MTQPNPSTALARAIVDELVRNGADHFVVSPGSRSAALAIAAAMHESVREVVVVDERSAGFRALGRAKATGLPTVVISTSGTAPANYLPAVVEADMALTPLIVLSADRPAEWRGVGANQTVDQVDLYGQRVRFFADVAAPSVAPDGNETWRTLVCTAVSAALGARGRPPGPVHLNIGFREPTVPVAYDGRSTSPPYPHDIVGREGDGPWVRHQSEPIVQPQVDLPSTSKGLVVAGEGAYDGEALIEVSSSLGWPVLVTALSGMRGMGGIATYHHLLAGGVPPHFRPDAVLAVGAVGPSRRVEELIAAAGHRVRVDPLGRNIDPGLNATRILQADPVGLLASVADQSGDSQWIDTWARANQRARSAIDDFLSEIAEPTGAGVVRALNNTTWGTLVAGSSLPIREVDAHLEKRGEVIANRGASGIDGFVSTALGVAWARERTLAISGDLGLLHDGNGFLGELPDDLVLVVLDNNGGGLFDELPPASHSPQFERLFITPHHRDLSRLASFHEVAYTQASDVSQVASLVDERLGKGVHIVNVPVDRGRDLEVRSKLDEIGAEVASSVQL